MAAEATQARGTRKRGRPIDVALGERILESTLRLLAQSGYGDLEIEAVAAAASCSKTTIYRRWGSKSGLVAAAIASEHENTVPVDTGNLLDDLMEHISHAPALLPFGSLPAAAWAAMLEPEISAALRSTVIQAQDAAADALFARAVLRGELPPDADGRAILHAALGLSLYRRYVSDGETVPSGTLRAVLSALIDTPPRREPDLAAQKNVEH